MGLTGKELLELSKNPIGGELSFADIKVEVDTDVVWVGENGKRRGSTITQLQSKMGGIARGIALARATKESGQSAFEALEVAQEALDAEQDEVNLATIGEEPVEGVCRV